ncbi:MAG: VCBS repeat-containing protein, partial [Acidimicrobiales bacterium]|nr:VCBS repeat-containing protein [Acidimicrobiales bacterium]
NADALTATDVNNDGDSDLVTAASFQVFVYLQHNGVLGPPGPLESHSTGQSGSALSFGDLNDDGTTDLISPSYYGELSVSYNETFNRFPVMPNQSMYAYGTLPSPLALSVTDEDLDDVVLSTLVAPMVGSVAYDGATITYQANPGQSGIDRFTVLAEDGRGGFAMSEITVTLVAPGSIAGTVDDGYRTLAGVMVDVFGAGGLVASTMTAADGTFAVPNLAGGVYQVRHRSPSGIYDEGWDRVEVKTGVAANGSMTLVRRNWREPIVVTTTTDGGSGSLREAVGWAAATEGADTIELAPGATYALGCAEGGVLEATGGAVTIVGDGSILEQTCPGHGAVRHDGSDEDPLTLVGVTVTGGDALGDGGGVYAEGDLYLVDAAIVANAAAGYGGGVYGGYHVWMVNSTVASNTAGEAGGGLAALDLEADAGSAIEDNDAPSGGGAYTFVTTLFGEVVGNHATAEGGGLVGAGVTLSPGALVAGNSSVGDGGGVWALEGVIVDGAVIDGNTAGGSGGGLASDGSLDVTRAAILDNEATSGAGLWGDSMTVEHTTVHGNVASVEGGGVLVGPGSATVHQVTLTDNEAPTRSTISYGLGGLELHGSVVAAAPGSPACGSTTGVPKPASGFNVVSDASCAGGIGDLVTADPVLEPLQAVAGGVPARRPAPSSPVFNRVAAGSGACDGGTTDQLGAARLQGPACEAGAVEGTAGATFGAVDTAGAGDEVVEAVASLTGGGMVVAGRFSGELSFGGQTRTSVGGTDGWVASVGPDGSVAWLVTLAGPGDEAVSALAVASDGEVVAGGTFTSAAGWSIGATAMPAAQGGSDGVLVKLLPSGAVRWHRVIGGSGSDTVDGLAASTAGHLMVSGVFEDALQVKATPTGQVTSAGGRDVFVARFGIGGGAYWVRGAGTTGDDVAASVTVSPNGMTSVAGTFAGTLQFSGAANQLASSAGSTDVFVWQLNQSGAQLRANRWGGPGSDVATGVAFDPSTGGVIIGGGFSGALIVGPPSNRHRVDSVDGVDGFALALDDTFAPRWLRRVGGVGDQQVDGVAVHDDGVVTSAVTGPGTISLDIDTRTAVLAGIGTVLVSFAPSGSTTRWLVAGDGPGNDIVSAFAGDGETVRVAVRHDSDVSIGEQTSHIDGGPDAAVATFVP